MEMSGKTVADSVLTCDLPRKKLRIALFLDKALTTRMKPRGRDSQRLVAYRGASHAKVGGVSRVKITQHNE